MLTHIMGVYLRHGFSEFVVATGFKGEVIREHYRLFPNVVCLDTGEDSGTGERVRACAEYLHGQDFLLTYGDGLANVNIRALLLQHVVFNHGVTVTAVHPPARFGQLVMDGVKVTQFNEKPHDQADWINGGFFVVEGKVGLEAKQWWEQETLPDLAARGLVRAYKHTGFWQCMDTQRDLNYLNELAKGEAPWTK
jgi:glucose-1-phosphate cytidylyltransferase